MKGEDHSFASGMPDAWWVDLLKADDGIDILPATDFAKGLWTGELF